VSMLTQQAFERRVLALDNSRERLCQKRFERRRVINEKLSSDERPPLCGSLGMRSATLSVARDRAVTLVAAR